MSDFRVRAAAIAAAVVLAGGLASVSVTAIGSSAALAQSTSSSPSTTSTISATADEVKEWSRKKWNAMKREWQKDKAKWDVCNQKAGDQKLSGKASWSFIYDCMKAS
jgi:hypothetical protein